MGEDGSVPPEVPEDATLGGRDQAWPTWREGTSMQFSPVPAGGAGSHMLLV